MEAWAEYINYWENLKLPDFLGIIFIFFMVLVTIASNMVMSKFFESKPSGRKTVLGMIHHVKFEHCYQFNMLQYK
jgi:hypothetical protein